MLGASWGVNLGVSRGADEENIVRWPFLVVWEREGNQLAGGELERMCERIDIEDN